MFVDGYGDDTNPREDQPETLEAIPYTKLNLSSQVKELSQVDSSHEQKNELRSKLNKEKHKPVWMNDYEL